MLKVFRDPFSGLTHLAGAILGLFGLSYLIDQTLASNHPENLVGIVVFGSSVVLMYSASAIYHLLHVSDATRKRLRRVDHTMIFLLIAGTYTPFCLIPRDFDWGMNLLVLIWSIAVAGILMKLVWMSAPRWVSTGIYILMGWISVGAFVPLLNVVSTQGIIGLVSGGLLYTGGAVIYALKKPDPFPPHFGFHEIWHLFVLAGTGCHFYSVTTLVDGK